MPELTDPLDRLPATSRAELETFGSALERVHLDDLPLYAVRPRQPDHRRAVEEAAVVARERGLEAAIDDAREAIVGYVTRQYTSSQVNVGMLGMNPVGQATVEDRVRVLHSIGDAVSAMVLGDALDEATRAELLGAWARLTA